MPRTAAAAVSQQTRVNKHRDNQSIELWDNPPEKQDNQDEKRWRQAMAFRRVLAAKKGDPNEPQPRNIRFDYSGIHLENENLDIELEIRESNMYKEKFMKTVDREQNFKKAKKDAEVMLQLKNAVNRRKPNTSFERVVKSACIRKESRVTVPKEKATQRRNTNANAGPQDSGVDTVDAKYQEIDDADSDTSSEPEEKPAPKPFNNLTMFLLSLQSFKSAGNKHRGDNVGEAKDIKDDNDEPPTHVPRTKSAIPRTRSAMPGSRSAKQGPRSALPRAKSAIQAEVCEKYGIHVQKDKSRSRRTLGDISKLEHDTKYKHVDKFEERRMKLLAACKDTKTLDSRIDTFLKDVDDFKKISRPDNSLERVLTRSKSAFGVRNPATELPTISVL